MTNIYNIHQYKFIACILPIYFRIELYIDEMYNVNPYNLMALKRFSAITFTILHINIFEGFKDFRSKINLYISHLAPTSYLSKVILLAYPHNGWFYELQLRYNSV